jgi:hypothetical protein
MMFKLYRRCRFADADARHRDCGCKDRSHAARIGHGSVQAYNGWVRICHRPVIFGMGAFQNRWAGGNSFLCPPARKSVAAARTSQRLSMLVWRGEFSGSDASWRRQVEGEDTQNTGHPHYLLSPVCSRQRRPRRVIALCTVDCRAGCEAQLALVQ